jgi:hypothetical protein
VRIKPKQSYYLAQMPSQNSEAKQYFCTGCYSGFGQHIEVEGVLMLKSQLTKRKNEEDLEEPWVQCDACEHWVHQVCTLFNSRRNEAGESPFTCPSCILEQMSRSERTPTVNRPSSQQPASSLPRTQLSDFLENYLQTALTSERADRARMLGKTPEEVPGAEGICMRVVSCVDKRMDVKSQFYRAFAGSNYPDHFMYRSKASSPRRLTAACTPPCSPPRADCLRSACVRRWCCSSSASRRLTSAFSVRAPFLRLSTRMPRALPSADASSRLPCQACTCRSTGLTSRTQTSAASTCRTWTA